MTARRGWCPDVHAPMAAADGLIVRVKPPLGRLSAKAARVIAAAALRDGSGMIELTARANLQVRGLRPDSAPQFAATMVAAGLAAADPAVERRRNVLVSPQAGADPAIAGDPEAVAATLLGALAMAHELEALPGKFGWLVDGGGVASVAGSAADILIRLGPDGALVSVAGAGLVHACDV
ncbi:MAG TPA: precorrin-3B synthase, partial [Acetobacteraceae bacterium]|nr:precorrin-3B synthase [Acetobacteraceae bacterium]